MTTEKGYGWGYNNGQYGKNTEMIFLVPEGEKHSIEKNIIDMKESRISDIKPEDKIYFHKSALFPRHKLKDIMSNPVTRKVDRADYVVINRNEVLYKFNRLQGDSFHKDHLGDWVETPWNLRNSVVSTRFVVPARRSGPTEHVDFLRVMEATAGKKIIYDSSLNQLVPRDVDIRGELYEKLDKLLSNNDVANIKIGVDILSNMNYQNNRTEVLLLLNRNFDNIRAWNANHTVMFKSLLDVVTKDYPYWNRSNFLSLALELMEEDRDSKTIQQAVVEHLNRKHTLKKGKYKITIDVETE